MLLWVLMIAFPMQGIAAAVMAGCGPNHHKVMTTDVSHAHESASNSHVHEAADNTHSDELQALDEAQPLIRSIRHFPNQNVVTAPRVVLLPLLLQQ